MAEITHEEQVLLTKKGTVRKRKPKKSNDYFTEDTQKAILEYRLSDNDLKRNRIYNERIHYAFYKLVENIIHSFKFYHLDTNSIEDLKYEVISFLLQKLHLYKEENGKAYSYFGTAVKRYLINYNKNNYKSKVAKAEIQEIDNDDKTIDALIYTEHVGQVEIDKLFNKYVETLKRDLFEIFQSPSELKTAAAIIQVFERRKNVDISNKKLMYIYVKEMVDVQTNTITKVIKKMKVVYKSVLNEYLQEMEY